MLRPWVPYLSLFTAAFVTVLATTPLARAFAWHIGAVDRPNKRRVNRVPIPRMGGIAIFLGIVAAFSMQYVGTMYLGWPMVLQSSPHLHLNYWYLVAAFFVIFLTKIKLSFG